MTEHMPTPWTDETGASIAEGDPRVLFNGVPPAVKCRVIAEANYQHAKHCVNCHDELVAACEWAREVLSHVPVNAPKLDAALAKAKAQ